MSEDTSKVSLTFKFNGEPPWLVVRGDTVQDVVKSADYVDQNGGFSKIGELHLSAQAQFNASSGGVTTSTPAPQPAAAQQAPALSEPNGTAPSCPHGQRIYKSGTGKTGKPWAAWMCPLPKERKSEQCSPEWA